jgi:outer membrane protein assembly factor BamB
MSELKKSLTVVLIEFAFVASLAAADASDKKSWPNWMGPNHDGVSLETDWNAKWPKDNLPTLWTRQIGIGFSSVSIAQGRLFTMGHVDGDEIVWCLDARSGNVLWTHRYPSELNDNLHEGGPGSTPTIDGDRVFTLGKEGQLFCLNAESGAVLWEKRLQDDLQVQLPEWGFASSPVIAGDQVILEGGRLVSYDKTSGKKNWQSARHEAGYSSAAVFSLGTNESFAASLDCDGLRITKLANGDQVAFYPWPSPFRTNATTPIVHRNRIFISTAYDIGCGLFEFNGQKLKLITSNKQMRNHFNNSILWEGFLYGFDGNSNLGRVVQLTCMNFETGEVAWKQRGFGCGSLIIADGKLLILGEGGDLVLANATPTAYEELTRTSFLSGRCWTVPVLFDKRIYGRNAAGKLICVDVSK